MIFQLAIFSSIVYLSQALSRWSLLNCENNTMAAFTANAEVAAKMMADKGELFSQDSNDLFYFYQDDFQNWKIYNYKTLSYHNLNFESCPSMLQVKSFRYFNQTAILGVCSDKTLHLYNTTNQTNVLHYLTKIYFGGSSDFIETLRLSQDDNRFFAYTCEGLVI